MKKCHTPEQIVKILRDAYARIIGSDTVERACRVLGISDTTYYTWRNRDGRMKVHELKRLKELGRENAQPKKLVADLPLDKAILKEALSGNY